MPSAGSPYYVSLSHSHSRDSSTESNASSPVTPTFSARGHGRFPSSNSSLVTSPDSPGAAPKSTLDDLVEEPAERDDRGSSDDLDEPLCICDTPLCAHRQSTASQSSIIPLPTPEWSPGDDYFSEGDGQLPGEPETKRRRSGEFTFTDSFAARLSRRFPSFRKRFTSHAPTSTLSTPSLRSAPHSRSASLKVKSTRSLVTSGVYDSRTIKTPASSPVSQQAHDRSVSPPSVRASSRATVQPREISLVSPDEDPIDRQELSSTPLLPPTMTNYFSDSSEAVQSPLQSPTVAAPSVAASIVNTPTSTPIINGFPTPPLSARASAASLNKSRSSHVLQPSSEIPALVIAEESDPWAIKLGHANFHISPEPYLPDICDAQSCSRLRDDWEAARVQYMRQAARTSEHFGVTSDIYRFTEEKWAEIDAEWRSNHEKACAEAQANGDIMPFQPLAKTQPVSKLPSLQDPQRPSKFPAVSEIVGPMVSYAKINHERPPSKKPSFLKIFTNFGSRK
ncbi:uncharacterized protein RCC_06196 [Ramularia collo-cygni]|uniref:Only prolin and serin are matching in the corresponding protein n=1 Tax=Ramularia collo-cygni TaxID=112498 RepID=A0A2D3V6K1_9PEZI|nr:uncharacterized protein RCC_06196 [Ramularia collo-cygni]CZT20337.1 uncharacterized protein RCC_06196 [Ramularia collo-cygni]